MKGSKTGKSASTKESVEEPIVKVIMDEATNTKGEDTYSGQPALESSKKQESEKSPEEIMKIKREKAEQPSRPPTLDPEWNKRQDVLDQPEQTWFKNMVSASEDSLTFDDLMATPNDFSKYVLNRLKIDNLSQDILIGPTFNLLK
nr:hypothetical protein [Tanacetum cinerariifolium]